MSEEFDNVTFLPQTQLQHTTCKVLIKYSKIKLVQYYEKKQKNKYDPKIKTVKYLELFDQN